MTKHLVGYRYPLPVIVNPPRRVCVQIEIPDEPAHWSAFYGALDTLCQGYRWADDEAHTAKRVVQVWRDVVFHIKRCENTPASGGLEIGDIMLLRQNPDNPCLLEMSLDGVHWCETGIDFSLCMPAAPQPGNGAEQPRPGGGQACYDGILQANGTWLMPTVVSTGDVIQLQTVNGAGNDGGSTSWKCATGDTFFAGSCLSGTGAIGSGDPAPLINHMRLLWNVAGIYYDAMAGPLTIPSGVSSAQVFLQVNDSDLTNNSGSYTFKACTTNNQSSSFIHTFDFTLSPQSFNVISYGSWSAGSGWLGQTNGQVTPGREIEMHRTFTALQGTSLSMTFDRGAGGDGICTLRAKHSGATVFQSSFSPGVDNGTDLIVSITGTGLVDEIYVDINSHPSTTPLTVKNLTITGLGSDPF